MPHPVSAAAFFGVPDPLLKRDFDMSLHPSLGTTFAALSRRLSVLLIPSVVLMLTGCRAQQLAADQTDMRRVLIDLYDVQVLDNLVRIVEGEPFVHMDYGMIVGTLTQQATVTLGGSYQDASSGFGETPGAGLPAAQGFPVDEVLTRAANGSVGGQQNQQLIRIWINERALPCTGMRRRI